MSYGEPEDVTGCCNARILVGDNYGDNHATFRCELEPGHGGDHRETFREGTAVLMWTHDERHRI